MVTSAGTSPLVWTALALIEDGATGGELARRFADHGATLRDGTAHELLGQLASLGLVHVAVGSGERRRWVRTSLGDQVAGNATRGPVADDLADLERLRTDLLSTIAHELRTPLTAVRTSAGLLLDPSAHPTEDQRRTLVETIERNAGRMQRIVGDILDLARFRAGRITLQLRRFDSPALARDVVAALAPLAGERGLRVEVTVARGASRVYGDHRRLEQALTNLVSNALRFARDRGRVDLYVEARGELTRWSVTDDGPGIPLEDQARLFERFFVGRSDRNEEREGVGLGLPTALAIAHAHGGTIEVHSRPGAGSTFSLVVPTDGPPGAD
jgi:signal transduction histidine kinase